MGRHHDRCGGGGRRPTAAAARALAAMRLQLLSTLAVCCLATSLGASAAPSDSEWTVVTSIHAADTGLDIAMVGPPQAPFPRPPPRTLDPHLLSDYATQLNLLQDVATDGSDTPFTDTSEQYVATAHQAFVEGEGGLVYDAAGRAFHLPGHFFGRAGAAPPLPTLAPSAAAAACTERHPVMASIVQRYGHMYYHFLAEALPRLALLQESGLLTSDVKLLTWGRPYEFEYLEALGVARHQIVPYNASRVYCADRLLVPTPIPRITPPKEGLLAVRHGLGVRELPLADRDLVVYVSRTGEPSRRVGNEAEVLAAIAAAFPGQQLAVFNGAEGLSLEQRMALFRRARVIVGPHGAGLTHLLFAAAGTAVVEFAFLADPPLMFWHAAAALGQSYWLLPVPQGYWMQEQMTVPAGEVVDILTAILRPAPASPPACAPGTGGAPGACIPCAAGSYAFSAGSAACRPCPAGRFAAAAGATGCRTCQPGTYSGDGGRACLPCPAGTFSVLPGAWEVGQCLTAEDRRQQQQDQAASVQLLSKLSPVFEDTRRRLIEAAGGAPLTPAELCAAQQLAAGRFTGPYAGPYLGGAALLANCTGLLQVAAPPAAAPAVPPMIAVVASLPLPPLDVPTLPPALLPSPALQPQEPRGVPVAEEPQEPQIYPAKKKAVDDYVIILACVLGGLLVIPLLIWLGRRLWLARQHRRSRAAAAVGAGASTGARRPLMEPGKIAFSNPAYAPTAAVGVPAPGSPRPNV